MTCSAFLFRIRARSIGTPTYYYNDTVVAGCADKSVGRLQAEDTRSSYV